MNKRRLEDLKAGQKFSSPAYEVKKDAMVRFASEFDPQPFHLDEAAAAKSLFRGLAASGWFTAAVSMRLMVSGEMNLDGGFIGLGVDGVRWPKPVRPGDVLRVESEVLEVRSSRSNAGRGIIKVRGTTINQKGEVVQTLVATMLARRRGPGEP